jgi:hypothetical protein
VRVSACAETVNSELAVVVMPSPCLEILDICAVAVVTTFVFSAY